MFTAFDKALVAVIGAALLWVNTKYGFKFSTDPADVQIISGFIEAALVYFVPNKIT